MFYSLSGKPITNLIEISRNPSALAFPSYRNIKSQLYTIEQEHIPHFPFLIP
jgi:hypothetical protein